MSLTHFRVFIYGIHVVICLYVYNCFVVDFFAHFV